MTLAIAIRLILICLIFVSCQEGDSTGIRRSRVSSGGGKRLKGLTIVSEVPTSRKQTTTQTRRLLEPEDVSLSKTTSKRLTVSEVPTSRRRTTYETRRLLEPEDVSKTTSGLLRQSKILTIVPEVPTSRRQIVSEVPTSRKRIVSEVPTSRRRTTYETRRLLEPEDVSKTTSGFLRQSKRLTISEVPASRKRTTYETRRFLEPEDVSKTTSGLPRRSKRLTIAEDPASRKRTTTQTRRLLEPEDTRLSKTTSGLPRQSKILTIVPEVSTSRKRTILSEVPASRRLTIVSEVPTSRKRTTYETRRLLEPEEGVSKTASLQQQVPTGRPEARSNYFDDLKQAKEGVWYRRVEDDEGVRLIRVKNDDAILNNGDQRNSNYQLSVEEEDPSARFWYRRLDDGDGGVRLVRVRNDDITIKSLKTFRTQNVTRTRTSEAV